jgi:aspartate/methionine/tyrosine aminotransferase
MKRGEAGRESTSTAVERIALDAAINLADSHARVLSDGAITSVFEQAARHFEKASTASHVELERSFTGAFEELYNIRFPRPPLLAYSTSSLAGLVGTFLGLGATVTWPVPSFDNIRDMVRHAGVRIDLVPEAAVRELSEDSAMQACADAIWLTLPNNPTGFVLNQDDYARLADSAAKRGVILIIDHCFRGYSPTLLRFDQYEVLEASGCRYIVLEDTGKTISTLDLKVGMLVASRDMQPQLRVLNEDLILNVSPFILIVLTSIMRAWRDQAGLRRLRQVIEGNRITIRQAYAGSSLVPCMRSTEIPVEWLDTGSSATARDLLDGCVARGLRLLPGASFFGQPNESGSSLLRIALTRDAPVVSAGANILGHVLFPGKTR